jgi:hypothetical protein
MLIDDTKVQGVGFKQPFGILKICLRKLYLDLNGFEGWMDKK